jgi:PAS domain S-box-containing protein
MNNTSKEAAAKLYWRKVQLSAIPLLLLIVGSCAHVLVAITDRTGFEWKIFAGWLLALVIATLIPFWNTWRYRKHLDPWKQLGVLDFGGTLLWYWGFATVYQALVMNFNPEQSAVNALAFFWEVPIVGGLAAITSQMQFKPLKRYMRTGRTDDPMKLYRLAESLPFKVIIRNSIAAVSGFAIGAAQITWLVGMSPIEIFKDVLLGFVVSIFVSLYFFLIFYKMVSPIKSRLITQYNLRNVVSVRYHNRVLTIIVLLTAGTLLLSSDIYINNYQKSINATIARDAQVRLTNLSEERLPLVDEDVKGLSFGENGTAYVLDRGDELPISDLNPWDAATYRTQNEGVIYDTGEKLRLIVFKTVGDQKVSSVVQLSDFYGGVAAPLASLLGGAALLILVTLAASLLFVNVLSETLRKLNAAVTNARKTGHYNEAIITTGDEFETISREFGHFVHETSAHSRRLSEEHARLEASIRSLELGMILCDTNGAILSMNQAAHHLLYNGERIILTLDELVTQLPHDIALKAYIERCLKHGKPVHIHDITYGSKYFDVFVAPIQSDDAATIGAITVIQDVTEQKVVQRSKDEFFSIASHELRTPLTAIRGNTDMIRSFFAPQLKKNPELADMIHDIYDSSVRLIAIVNDFLDVSRLEQGKMVFNTSEVSLEKVIEAVVYDMRANINAKNVSLTIDHKTLNRLPNVWVDEGRIKQVLYNLIGNAAKFTDKGSITVKSEKHGQLIKVSVIDTGPGISPDMQKLLFRKFQQASESLLTRDATRGTGLGLYISKFIVEAMGGQVRLERSEVGKGSEFSFTVPIATESRIKQKSTVAQVDVVTGLSKK